MTHHDFHPVKGESVKLMERFDMKASLDNLSEKAYGMKLSEAHARKVCVRCHEKATWYSEDGAREYRISGLCEPCFDEMFEEKDTERED